MNNFPPHGPQGMVNPGMGIPMGAQMPGNTMSPGMGGHRAPNMMGVSLSRSLFFFSVLRIAPSSNCNITKVFTRSQRVLQWRICQEAERALLLPVNLRSIRVQDNNPLFLAHKTTVWDKTNPWG